MKKRLDVLLVERGLAESRTQAQALVMAGLVPGYDKPGQQVDDGAELSVKTRTAYVSRGGEKLANALDALRDDPRVTVLERTNARTLAGLPFAPQLVVCDVSFISVKTALPPVLELAAPGWQAVVLVKPQFEAGRADVAKGSGVVRDPVIRARVLREVAYAALGWEAQVAGVLDSGLPGPKGNREFFLHLTHNDHPKL